MDLAEIIDATIPVEVDFKSTKLTAHVYTSGPNRLTVEEREKVKEAQQLLRREPDQEPDVKNVIKGARLMLPLMVGRISANGGDEILFRGQSYPDCVPLFPDELLVTLIDKAQENWGDPTNAETSQTVSAQTESANELAAQ